jgi:hypothetical protein
MISLFICLLCLCIAYEDFKYRWVKVLWFISLFILIGIARYLETNKTELWHDFSINLVFVVLLIAVLWLYTYTKEKKWTALWEVYFGLGDFIMLLELALAFEPLFFLLFFCLSNLISLLVFFVFCGLKKAQRGSFTFPLAGIWSIGLCLWQTLKELNLVEVLLYKLEDFILVNFITYI